MRIIWALDKYTRGTGGAVFSARGIAGALDAAGHDVRVLEVAQQGALPSPEPDRNEIELKAYPLTHLMGIRDGHFNLLHWTRRWRPLIDREIVAFSPDVVLTQNVLAPASVAAARAAGIPVILFFRGYGCLAPGFFYNRDALSNGRPGFQSQPLRRKLKWPLVLHALSLYREAYAAADTVVANSRYTARVIERFFEREADVLYPVLDLTDGEERPSISREGPILMIKPSRVKGADVLAAVALASPNREFSVAGRLSRLVRRRLSGIPNLNLRGWIADREELYRGASLLLGPARIPEPFGRIFVEAGLRGIPSVASRSGGIVEAVGGGGVLVNPDAGAREWSRALERALEPETYAGLSREAATHSRSLIHRYGAERLLDILERTVGRTRP